MTAYSITGNYDLSMDIMQETFYRIMKYSRHIEYSTAYIIRTAHNIAINMQKRESRMFEYRDSPVVADFDNAIEVQRQLKILERKMHALSPKEREVFSMKFYGGLDYREIAQACAIKQSTARVLFKRAIDKFREKDDV